MATAKKTAKSAATPADDETSTDLALAPKKGGAVMSWEDQLAADAAESAKIEENTGGGAFFSTKAGVLSWDSAAIPNNEMAVVILDHIIENVFYREKFDADNPVAPDAYSLGRDEKTMRWTDDSIPEYAGQLCKDSDINQFGSADVGRGKAARNMRRLALIPAGDLKNGKLVLHKAAALQEAKIGYLKVPPTSIIAFATFVKQLAGSLKRPPHGIVTKIKVVPDAKSQFRMEFTPLTNLGNDVGPVVLSRREEAKLGIMQPYQMNHDAPEAKAKPKAATTKKPAGKSAPAKSANAKRRF